MVLSEGCARFADVFVLPKKDKNKSRGKKKTEYNMSSSVKNNRNVMGKAISGVAKGFGYTLKRYFA